MLCQNCNKNEANVKYTEIINGEKRQMMLCDQCSHELGLDNINFNMPIDFSSFFGGLLEEEINNSQEFMPLFKQAKELRCNNCNMTYNDFINQGKFGCSNCYEVFSEKINLLLKRLHGNSKHKGRKCLANQEENKINKQAESKKIYVSENKLEKLEKELKEAIKDERYEDAAKIRDEIKKINAK